MTDEQQRILTSAEIEERLDALGRQLAERRAALAAAETGFGEALAAQMLGESDAAALQRARKARDAAGAAVEEIAVTITALQGRLELAQAAEQLAELRERQAKARQIADARQAAFERLQTSLNTFAADYREALQLNEALFSALPAIPDPDAGMLRIANIEEALRKNLIRSGMNWALDWPWGAHGLPEFIETVGPSHGVIHAWLEA
jgi:hypothetical protein